MGRKKKDMTMSVFNYDNYRQYLEDMYQKLKIEQRGFSFRAFSVMAGLTSPNFLKLVMNGDRNLTKESVLKFSKALRHNKREHEYFENLVFFNQSMVTEEKNFYYEKLRKFRDSKEVKKLEKSHYEFCSHWFIPVIREMIDLEDFVPDPSWIANRINPSIKKSDALMALEVLEEMGFIFKKDGTYQKREKSLTTGTEVRNVFARNILHQMILLGKEAIDRIPSEKRDISSLTLSITEQQFKAIKDRIIAFRKEILNLATSDDRTDRIYQFNFQFFPLLKDKDEE